MNIAVLVDQYPNETFVVRQVEALGARVYTGTVNTTNASSDDHSDRVYSISDNKPFKPTFLLRLQSKIYKDRIAALQMRFDRTTQAQFELYIKQHGIQAILAQFGPNGIRAIKSCEALNVPLIVHLHGYDVSSLIRYNNYKTELQSLFTRAQAFIVVSSKMRDDIISLGCPKEKITIIHCGVPISQIDFVDRRPTSICSFINVGRLVEKKAPITMVKAFEQCAELEPNVKLSIVGDGPLFNQTNDYVSSSRHASKIKLLGRQPVESVIRLMQQSDCYIQHSITAQNGDQEGWPVSIAEAAATGLPIISTRHAGIVEQVVEGESGYLVEENDWRSMGYMMAETAQNLDWRILAGKRSRDHISRTGDFDLMITRLRGLIASVIETHRLN